MFIQLFPVSNIIFVCSCDIFLLFNEKKSITINLFIQCLPDIIIKTKITASWHVPGLLWQIYWINVRLNEWFDKNKFILADKMKHVIKVTDWSDVTREKIQLSDVAGFLFSKKYLVAIYCQNSTRLGLKNTKEQQQKSC